MVSKTLFLFCFDSVFFFAQSALFNFQSLLIVVLLFICTCAYVHTHMPSLLDRNKTGCVSFFFFQFFICSSLTSDKNQKNQNLGSALQRSEDWRTAESVRESVLHCNGSVHVVLPMKNTSICSLWSCLFFSFLLLFFFFFFPFYFWNSFKGKLHSSFFFFFFYQTNRNTTKHTQRYKKKRKGRKIFFNCWPALPSFVRFLFFWHREWTVVQGVVFFSRQWLVVFREVPLVSIGVLCFSSSIGQHLPGVFG